MNSLLKAIAEHAADQPEKIAVATSDTSTSYFELNLRVEQLAKIICKTNYKVIALQEENSLAWIIIDLACQKAGICLIPLPSFFTNAQLEFTLSSSGSQAIIAADNLQLSCINKQPINLTKSLGTNLSLFQLDSASADIPISTSKITFTSGSTGHPKGVCLSIKQMLDVAQSVATILPKESISSHLCILPLAILLENVAGVYTSFLLGARVIILPMSDIGFTGSSQFNPVKLIEVLNRYKPNSLILLPQLLESILQVTPLNLPDSLKFIAVGGGKVAPFQILQARQLGLPIYEGYGLSESASVVSLNTLDLEKPGSVGQFLPHINAYINKDGELIIRGKTFLGYLNDKSSWNSELLATGDLVILDNQRFISINGRKKNLIISSFGRNISPEWIEASFQQIHSIFQCVVFGDAKPYCVALFTTHSKFSDQQLEKQQIKNEIAKINLQLPDYAQLKDWIFLPTPITIEQGLLTSNGRFKRELIAQKYNEEISQLYQANAD